MESLLSSKNILITGGTSTLGSAYVKKAPTRDATIQTMGAEDWDEVMKVNLKAPYFLTKEPLSLLFKAGLAALAKSLAQELGRKRAFSRISDPDEVADFLVYLSSDRMTPATGQLFHYEPRRT